jgi:hypothetical protein
MEAPANLEERLAHIEAVLARIEPWLDHLEAIGHKGPLTNLGLLASMGVLAPFAKRKTGG